MPLKDNPKTSMRGRDLVTGLPKEIIVYNEQILKATRKSVMQIVDAIKTTIEETPPELVADIMQKGIILAGGGALLKGLDKLIAQQTETQVHIADDPLTSVVRGTGVVLEDLDSLKDVLLPTEFRK